MVGSSAAVDSLLYWLEMANRFQARFARPRIHHVAAHVTQSIMGFSSCNTGAIAFVTAEVGYVVDPHN